MRILALDVGTSSVKAAVLDAATGDHVGPIARCEYELDSPVLEAAEIPAERLWGAVTSAARQAVRHTGVVAGGDVEGIGLSVMTPALVLLDKSDRPLFPIITHLDRRSRPAARQVQGEVGAEFLAETGNRPLPGGISALCWRQLVSEEPYLTHDVGAYLHVNGWLALRMTGEKGFDKGNACFTGLYDALTEHHWAPRWLNYFQVDPAWLPPVHSGDGTIGQVRSAVAAELGVPAGIPVKLGTADTSCAMLAANMGEGDLLHVVGTTQVLATIVRTPIPAAQRVTRYFGVGDLFLHVAHNPVGGVALEWLHKLCFRDVPSEAFYHEVIEEARCRRTRVTLDPPFLGGDRLQIEAHRAAFRDLELHTDRLDLLAALLQAMEKGHRDTLANLGPFGPYRRIILTGGGADVVKRLLPEYHAVEPLEEGSLRGVAWLFQARPAAAAR
ncbi:MAG: FGGY-family carbohydrate kinase [Gemmataceae bacterium]